MKPAYWLAVCCAIGILVALASEWALKQEERDHQGDFVPEDFARRKR